jgi:hypothetical protein
MLLERAIKQKTAAPTGHHGQLNSKAAQQPDTVAGVWRVVTGHSGICSVTNAGNKDDPEPPQIFGKLNMHDNNKVPISQSF